MDKEKVKEKKKLSIKEIGPARLVILLMAGIFLLVLSFPDMLSSENSSKDNTAKQDNKVKVNSDNTETDDETEVYINELENRLKKVLAKVEGIGDVDVMITLKGSKEKVILKDGPYTQESMNEVDGEGGNRDSSNISKEDTTVLVNGGNGESVPYVIQEKEPEVEGVVVIAEGGGNAKIMTEIMEAAQVLFNVPAHKVKVMKMNK
ncbi:stage III sporulation protein AG [Anaerocolumna sp. MB42-C2]|uniref:stage III sporulation protein AG n=1 Tax=Anaerocolumna sp. MB42-C2 TaxID=3070997 RepID=UPI0027E1D928|nr:stage III sporulation protein AG [Anaerocolumna sp. MB42-C2]WMJ87648.1 stage III sporulation protein AG [Anaerocolumna sp. MB42-C2]